MPASLRLALAQVDLVVGDIAGNEAHLREYLEHARGAGAQVVVFPELAVTGYPPDDLLLKRHFLADARAALERMAADARGIVGAAWRHLLRVISPTDPSLRTFVEAWLDVGRR